MLLELQSDGTAVVTRGTTFQGQSGNTFIIGTFTTTPITPVANMVMEYNITRPDNEQSGWQPMNKVASELRWYYGLQGWDTTVSGTAKVALRWYDVSLATPVYTVTQEYDMIIKKGVIAQPVGIDDENYNTLIALIPALQTNKMDFYDISSPELLPPAVDYAEDGIKTANAFYYPFEKTVNLYNSTDTLATSGTLYVTKNDTAMRQYEYLFAGNGKNIDSPQIFTRQITYDSEGAVTSVGSFRQVDTDVYIGLKQVTDAIEADITSLQSTKQDKTDTDLETTDKTVVGAINELNTNKLNKNFSALVERTYLQLQDWVALQSEGGNYKTSIQTLKAYLTQGLVGLSFDILDELPSTGMENIIYLIPLSDSIVHVTDYASLPETGTADILYITDDDGARYQWDTDTSSYITYSLGYEEYIWLEETSAYELIGSTQIDLTGYATTTFVTENFTTKSEFNGLVESLNGGTIGQILAKASNDNLDVEWIEKPTAPIQEIQVNGVEVEPVGGVVDIPTIAVNGIDYVRDPAKTYLVIKQSTAGEFQLLTQTSGTNNFTVDWGDGETEAVTTLGAISHTYANAGMYLITIDGTFAGFYVNGNTTYRDKYIEVYFGTNSSVVSAEAFENCFELIIADCTYVTELKTRALYNCYRIKNINADVLMTLGDYALYGTGIEYLSLPKVTTFGVCGYMPKLHTIYIPLVTSLDSYALRHNTVLYKVIAPQVTSIGSSYVFDNNPRMKELVIGNITTTSVFSNCFSSVVLDKLTISGSPNDTDIARILNLFSTGGGSFSNSATIQYSGQVSKVPTLDNDIANKKYVDDQDATKITKVSSPTANDIALLDSGGSVIDSGKQITTTAPSSSSDDTTVPTSKAVSTAVAAGTGNISANLIASNVALNSSTFTNILTDTSSLAHRVFDILFAQEHTYSGGYEYASFSTQRIIPFSYTAATDYVYVNIPLTDLNSTTPTATTAIVTLTLSSDNLTLTAKVLTNPISDSVYIVEIREVFN